MILITVDKNNQNMNNLLRGLIAGYGAKKIGGGCLGTVVVFLINMVGAGKLLERNSRIMVLLYFIVW
jgi:hypothetical protein